MDNRSEIIVRDATPVDYKRILEINEADVEVLSPLDEETLDKIAACTDMFQVVEIDGEIAAFLTVMRESSDYWSDNFKWFCEHYPKFLYVDRIAVDMRFRGMGIARRLYQGVIDKARELELPYVTAEIDIAPIYNDASMKFHTAMGFTEVGTKPFKETITVSLQKLERRQFSE